MPPLSLYPFFNTTGEYCSTEVGAFVSFTGAGITIDPDTGDIWFADYCRKRLGASDRSSCRCWQRLGVACRDRRQTAPIRASGFRPIGGPECLTPSVPGRRDY